MEALPPPPSSCPHMCLHRLHLQLLGQGEVAARCGAADLARRGVVRPRSLLRRVERAQPPAWSSVRGPWRRVGGSTMKFTPACARADKCGAGSPQADAHMHRLGRRTPYSWPCTITTTGCAGPHLRAPICGSLISAAHLPHGRWRTPMCFCRAVGEAVGVVVGGRAHAIARMSALAWLAPLMHHRKHHTHTSSLV